MTDILTDPRLSKPLAKLYALCSHAETLNDPLTSTGGGACSSSKPGSKPPGATQCDWASRRLASILDDAVEKATKALKAAQPRERRAVEVKTVGGIKVANSDTDTTTVRSASQARLQRHLVAKAAEHGFTIIATSKPQPQRKP